MHDLAIVKPACFPPATCLFHNICAQVNKMPEGPLFKAAEAGNTEVSVAVISLIGQLLTVPHTPPTMTTNRPLHTKLLTRLL